MRNWLIGIAATVATAAAAASLATLGIEPPTGWDGPGTVIVEPSAASQWPSSMTLATPTMQAAVASGSIPADRLPPNGWENVVWSDPGGWTTINVTNDSRLSAAQRLPANDPGVDASDRIRAILAATSGRRILYFPAGSYYFKTNLRITVGDLQIVGVGDATRLVQQQSANPGRIEFVGSTAGGSPHVPGNLTGTISIISPPPLGAQSITVSDASTIQVGDLVDVFQTYTPAYAADSWAAEAFGQIVRVTSKSGNTLGLSMKLGLGFSAGQNPRIREIYPLRNIQLKDFYIERAIDNDEIDSIRLQYVENALVYRIRSYRASARAHVNISSSHRAAVVASGFDGAWRTTGGGYAYGVTVGLNSSQTKIVDNWFKNLRHHVLLQAGANHTVVAYNSMEGAYYDGSGTGSDLSLHGNNAHNNLFEGNQFSKGAHDGQHGDNGPRNTYYRNNGARIRIAPNPTDRNNVIGNNLSAELYFGTGSTANFVEGNRVAGTVQWQTLSSGSSLPPSLYLGSKPAFFGTKPFPLFGPGVSDYGAANSTPAADRS